MKPLNLIYIMLSFFAGFVVAIVLHVGESHEPRKLKLEPCPKIRQAEYTVINYDSVMMGNKKVKYNWHIKK